MSAASIFSTRLQLEEISRILSGYIRLPLSTDNIPGALMEACLAHVRGGAVLRTYDFVDVINTRSRLGWQVKSTKAQTPVTWKRAKIPNADRLIVASQRSEEGCQALGDAIIRFCNDHAAESLDRYNLDQIGYSRLIVNDTSSVTYFERLLCTSESPELFDASQFRWVWSNPKRTKKKEQLPALHGRHRKDGAKWFAWHGLGENQLHFSGESKWWPVGEDQNCIKFRFPGLNERIELEAFMKFLARAEF